MSLNYDNAVSMLARIEIENINGRWNQTEWGICEVPPGKDLIVDDKTGLPVGFGSCQSGMCAAGWALTLAGVRLRWERLDDIEWVVETTETGESVPRAACRWLGMDWLPDTEEEWDGEDPRWNYEQGFPHLFDHTNTLDDLYREVTLWMDDPDEARLRADVAARAEQMQKEAVAKTT